MKLLSSLQKLESMSCQYNYQLKLIEELLEEAHQKAL